MKESHCGLDDACPLNHGDFLEAPAKLKNYVNHLSVHWWADGLQGNEGFSSLNSSRVSSCFSANLKVLEARKGEGLVGKSSKTGERSYATT